MLQRKDNTLRTCKELLLEFNKEKIQVNSSKIKFILKQNGKDVYNITAPFLQMERLGLQDGSRRETVSIPGLAFSKRAKASGWKQNGKP